MPYDMTFYSFIMLLIQKCCSGLYTAYDGGFYMAIEFPATSQEQSWRCSRLIQKHLQIFEAYGVYTLDVLVNIVLWESNCNSSSVFAC